MFLVAAEEDQLFWGPTVLGVVLGRHKNTKNRSAGGGEDKVAEPR